MRPLTRRPHVVIELWIAVIPILSAECECKHPRIIAARSSLKLIIGNVKGKDVFNDQSVGRIVHRCPLLKWNSDPKVITLIEQISESRLACCADLILIVENPRYAGIAMALSWSGEKGQKSSIGRR